MAVHHQHQRTYTYKLTLEKKPSVLGEVEGDSFGDLGDVDGVICVFPPAESEVVGTRGLRGGESDRYAAGGILVAGGHAEDTVGGHRDVKKVNPCCAGEGGKDDS